MKNKGEVRPWLRYLARYIDIAVYGIILMMMVAISAVILGFLGTNVSFLSTVPQLVFTVLYVIFLILIESMVFSHWQTTLGKKFLKIKINKLDESKIAYSDALKRTVQVWFKGLGFGIPLISLFTQINAYGNLTDKGITSWDRDGEFDVKQEQIDTWRIVVATILVACIMLLYIMMQVNGVSA